MSNLESLSTEELLRIAQRGQKPAPSGPASFDERFGAGPMASQSDPMEMLSTEQLIKIAQSKPTKGESAFLGGIKGMTANYIDEISAGLNAGYDKITGQDDLGSAYDRHLGSARTKLRAAEKENPKSFLAGQVGGSVLPAFALPGAGAGNLMAQTARAGAIGLGYGAAAGFGEGEGLSDRINKAETGAVIGGVTGLAAPGVIEGVKFATRPFVNAAKGLFPERLATKQVSDAIGRDRAAGRAGMTPDELRAAQAAEKPVVAADLGGETTRALARSAANTSPEARSALGGVVEDRFRGQSGRVAEAVGAESRLAGIAPEDVPAVLKERAKEVNSPAYRELFNKNRNIVFDEEIEAISQAPAVQQAIKDAVSVGNNRAVAEKLPPIDPNYRNLQFWNEVYKNLRDRANNLYRAGEGGAADPISNLSKQLRSRLDHVAPEYAKVRGNAKAFFDAEDAFEAGTKFAKSSPDSMKFTDAAKNLSGMKEGEKELFREAYLLALKDKASKIPDTRDVTKALFNSPADRQRAELALGVDSVKRLTSELQVERAMDALRGALGNSTTARQLNEQGMAGLGNIARHAAESGAAGAVGGALAGLYTGDWSPKTLGLGALGGAALRAGASKIDAQVAKRVGELLASNDPQKINLLIQSAAKSPRYMEALRDLTINLATVNAPRATQKMFSRGAMPSLASEGETDK
jgi:hypothetical protein